MPRAEDQAGVAQLVAGELVRGGERHRAHQLAARREGAGSISRANPGSGVAIAYSVIAFAPIAP